MNVSTKKQTKKVLIPIREKDIEIGQTKLVWDKEQWDQGSYQAFSFGSLALDKKKLLSECIWVQT